MTKKLTSPKKESTAILVISIPGPMPVRLHSFKTLVSRSSSRLSLTLHCRPFGRIFPIAQSSRTFHSSLTRREQDFDPRTIERESDEVDVCIVGGGPAGLSAAIRLKQLAEKHGREIRVLVLEKGGEMGTTLLNSPNCGRSNLNRRTHSLGSSNTNEFVGRVIPELVRGSSTTHYPCEK